MPFSPVIGGRGAVTEGLRSRVKAYAAPPHTRYGEYSAASYGAPQPPITGESRRCGMPFSPVIGVGGAVTDGLRSRVKAYAAPPHTRYGEHSAASDDAPQPPITGESGRCGMPFSPVIGVGGRLPTGRGPMLRRMPLPPHTRYGKHSAASNRAPQPPIMGESGRCGSLFSPVIGGRGGGYRRATVPC